MLPFRLIYHPNYDLNFGQHVFVSQKYRLIHDQLLREKLADEGDFEAPEPATDADLLLVHERGWIERLAQGTLSSREEMRLEVPYSPEMVRAFWLAAGGSILAARRALRDGFAFHIGGGFHHAFPGHGEGFCAIHDVAVAIRKMQQEGLIETAAVIDCDVHHGNGTAAIFEGDPSVMTVSLHQYNNYPMEKPPSSLDVHLPDRVGDEEYLERLNQVCDLSMALDFRPQLLFYIAGADPYEDDQLGGLRLTKEGLYRRDKMVYQAARKLGVPVAVTLAGGYARRVEDTIAIHCNSVRAGRDVYASESSSSSKE